MPRVRARWGFCRGSAVHGELFRSSDGRFLAQVPVDSRREVYGIRSDGFRDWLMNGYRKSQGEPPSSWQFGA